MRGSPWPLTNQKFPRALFIILRAMWKKYRPWSQIDIVVLPLAV